VNVITCISFYGDLLRRFHSDQKSFRHSLFTLNTAAVNTRSLDRAAPAMRERTSNQLDDRRIDNDKSIRSLFLSFPSEFTTLDFRRAKVISAEEIARLSLWIRIRTWLTANRFLFLVSSDMCFLSVMYGRLNWLLVGFHYIMSVIPYHTTGKNWSIVIWRTCIINAGGHSTLHCTCHLGLGSAKSSLFVSFTEKKSAYNLPPRVVCISQSYKRQKRKCLSIINVMR